MSTGIEILDVVADMQEALKLVAPSFDDEKSLAQNDVPRRLVWVLEQADPGPPDSVGGNPEVLHTEAWRYSVHCWGADKKEALRVRQALLTVLRFYLSDPNYELLRTTFLGGKAHTSHGFVAICELEIKRDTFKADLEAIAATGTVQDEIRRTTRATQVELEPDGTEGDGILSSLES